MKVKNLSICDSLISQKFKLFAKKLIKMELFIDN